LLLGHGTRCFAPVAQGAAKTSPGAMGGGGVWESSMNRTNGFMDVPGIA
jgi:hypothetical protein